MHRWKTICCPTAFSPSDRNAIAVAARLAVHARAQLTLLHVHQGISAKLQKMLGVGSAERVEQELAEASEALAKAVEAAERLAPGRVSGTLLRGDAAEGILLYARRHRPDAIVLARSGSRSGARSRALGEVALEVVRRAPCTVVVVRPDALVAVS